MSGQTTLEQTAADGGSVIVRTSAGEDSDVTITILQGARAPAAVVRLSRAEAAGFFRVALRVVEGPHE